MESNTLKWKPIFQSGTLFRTIDLPPTLGLEGELHNKTIITKDECFFKLKMLKDRG
jgi:hypothetical protein